MTERQDDFEHRFSDEFRAYLADGAPTTDPRMVARHIAIAPPPRSTRWGGAMAAVGGTVVTVAAVLALVFVRIGTPPVASSPSPSALDSPSPSAPPATVECLLDQPICQAVKEALGPDFRGPARIVMNVAPPCETSVCHPLLGPDLVAYVRVEYPDGRPDANLLCMSMAGSDAIGCGPVPK